MNTLSEQAPGSGQGLWQWLLRSIGLESWFQQAPTEARTNQEERVFLRLALPADKQHPAGEQASFLAKALSDCAPALRAGGSEVISHKGGTLLLSWPAAATAQATLVLNTFFQLSGALQRHGYQGPSLCGAASLGWAAASQNGSQRRYRGEVVSSVAGIVHEAERLGGGLFIAAALHYQVALNTPFEYELHVGFKVPGHRYPATLYRVKAAPAAKI